MIAFIGTGLLGGNFVQSMLRRDEQVHVWNRTTAKAKVLEAFGAKAFDNVADAVRGANRVHLALKDDDAVNEVLEKASAGFEPGVLIIDHTTTTAEGAARRTEQWKKRGCTYLHAPVFMGPLNAFENTGFMMVSGDQEVIKNIEPELAKMTGKLLNFGAENNKAAGIKLIGNLFLIAMTAGVADMLALSTALNIPPQEVSQLFNEWNPVGALPARIKKITSGSFDKPSWELSMARKDVGLMIKEAKRGGKELKIIPAIAAEMDRWIEKGHGNDDWTVIGKDAVS